MYIYGVYKIVVDVQDIVYSPCKCLVTLQICTFLEITHSPTLLLPKAKLLSSQLGKLVFRESLPQIHWHVSLNELSLLSPTPSRVYSVFKCPSTPSLPYMSCHCPGPAPLTPHVDWCSSLLPGLCSLCPSSGPFSILQPERSFWPWPFPARHAAPQASIPSWDTGCPCFSHTQLPVFCKHQEPLAPDLWPEPVLQVGAVFSCTWAHAQMSLCNWVIQTRSPPGIRGLCNRLWSWSSHTGGILGPGALSHLCVSEHVEQSLECGRCLMTVHRTPSRGRVSPWVRAWRRLAPGRGSLCCREMEMECGKMGDNYGPNSGFPISIPSAIFSPE